MSDRVYIDVHVASKKMFRLRILRAAEIFFNKDLSAVGCSERPEQGTHQ
jgi:hypothetical protein